MIADESSVTAGRSARASSLAAPPAASLTRREPHGALASSGATSVQIVTRYDEFLALQPEWDELYAAAGDVSPTLRHVWVRNAWLDAKRKGQRPLAVLVRRGGRLDMAGPFTLGFDRFKPTLLFLKGSLPHNDELLWRPGGPTTADAVALLGALRDRLLLPRFQRHGRFLDSSPFLAAVRQMGLPKEPRQSWTRYFLDASAFGNYEEYLVSLGPSARHNFLRRLRRLRETGNFEFRREQGEAARAPLAWLLETKRRWAIENKKSAPWLIGGEVDRFLERVLYAPDAPAWSLWMMYLDGRPLAAQLSFEEQRTWHFHMVGNDPAARQFAPGRAVIMLALEQAFAAGVERVAFGTTGDEWKARLLNGRETTVAMKIRIK